MDLIDIRRLYCGVMGARSDQFDAPLIWRNWDASVSDSRRLLEVALYTDAHITGEIAKVGPIAILNTIPGFPDRTLRPAMVLRVPIEVEFLIDMSRRRTGAYHGGSLFDEVASLISLCLGIRCRSGGITRRWDIKDDPFGRPYEFDHRAPYLPINDDRRLMISSATDTVLLSNLETPFAIFGSTAPRAATALVRAARLYQQAVWAAESDPNQAWILLVSAVEVAAALDYFAARGSIETIHDAWPEMAAILTRIPHEAAAEVADLISPLIKSTSKFLNFLLAYMPDPPSSRPSDALQADWTSIRKRLSKVYDYRSQALHAGSPFPAPLLRAPISPDEGAPSEIPPGSAAGDGTSVWLAKDLPMHLHLFEYVVRGALNKWWRGAGQAK